jgi:uncharacterized protein YegJ (DUF2314 family)
MGLWSWFKNLFGGEHPKRKKKRRRRKQERPMRSLVLFLKEPMYLDRAMLIQVINRTFGTDFAPDQPPAEDDTEFIGGEAPAFAAQFLDRHLSILCFPTPYFDEPQKVAEQTKDLRQRKVILEHQAWLSVDHMMAWNEAAREDPYRSIGKLLAALAPDDPLAIFWPEKGGLVVWDAELEAKLQSNDPLEIFHDLPPKVPVVGVAEDDPRMQKAVAEARRRWPEFTAAFAKRRPDQNFSVKVPISDGEHTEFIWVTVLSLDYGMIYGKIDNDPMELTNVKYGSRVRVKPSILNDWAYMDKEEMIGGFTIKLLKELQGGQADE